MADESSFYGTWKIVECVSLAGTVESPGIEGTEFTLDESGDVSWRVPEDAEPMPFFACETYEVCFGEHTSLKFFESFGHVIRFKAELSMSENQEQDLMLLTYHTCCLLQCQKISSNDPKDEAPFSLLGALEEGYFSDLIIKADNGKEFRVHKTVLQLVGGELDWKATPPPLSGLPEPVLHSILHYLYAECLPHNLDEETAKHCIKVTSKMPGFSRFSQLCDTFLKNTALKQQIVGLVTEMHGCADKIIDLFNGKGVNADGHRYTDEGIMTNPAKLSYVFVQALRELAVAGAKAFILCDLFTKRKGKLSREERHEIIKYAKSRLPVFMNQLCRLLEVCKLHSSSLTVDQRYEIAAYMVPEIESAFDLISSFVVETKSALEQVINSSSTPDKTDKADNKHKRGQVLGKSLRNALHMRELMKLKNFHEKTTQNFVELMQKRESFSLMSPQGKIRSVSKGLDQLIEDIPSFQSRIEELMSALEEKGTWREWKYLFKLGTSKVAWMLAKLQNHRPMLQSMIDQICDMVHKDQFNQCLVTLGLRDPPAAATDSLAGGATAATPAAPSRNTQLSCVESLCKSPYAEDSMLALNAFDLLKREENTDMIFEVITVQESGDMVIDHTHGGEPVTRTDHGKEVDITLIKAHCVVIAARCDWFRRALLSGMRESIDKKITVHDTQPELFRIFLDYLYGGQLDSAGLTIDQMADLMALADRYEMDSLKFACEHTLRQHHLDEDSALFLLSLADQFNSRILKSATLSYISDHPQVTECDVFEDLPDHLQAIVEDTIKWPRPDRDGGPGACLSGHSHTETPSSLSSVSEMDELMCTLDLGERTHASSSSSSEELQFLEDSPRLERCLSDLRDVLGDEVPREELKRIAIAADYDTNRALNFHFSS